MNLRSMSGEGWCRLILQSLAGSFVVVGALFFFFPDGTLRFMNGLGAWFGNFTPAPASAMRFWLSLGTGYMVLVTALAFLAQRDLHRRRELLLLLALGKATSSLTCWGFYAYSSNSFIYLANFLVDGSIAITALVIWMLVPSLRLPATASSLSDLSTAERPNTSAGHVRWRPPECGGLRSAGGERATTRTLAAGPGADIAAAPKGATAPPMFAALIETLLPAGGPFEEGGLGVVQAQDIESFVGALGGSSGRGLWLALRLLDLYPLVLPPRQGRRFSQLAVAQRVEVLGAWEHSRLVPLRQFVHALKLLVMTHFYSHPEIEARLGYPHPLVRVPRPEAGSSFGAFAEGRHSS